MEEIVIEYLRERLRATAIRLYGSYVKGRFGDASDLDVAFLSDERFEPSEIIDAGQELAARLNRDVDLVDFRQADPALQMEIIRAGRVIYDSDEDDRCLTEAYAISDYQRFVEEIAIITEKRYGYSHR